MACQMEDLTAAKGDLNVQTWRFGGEIQNVMSDWRLMRQGELERKERKSGNP